MNMAGRILHLIANRLFGWRRYRIQLIYKDRFGGKVFSVTTTIGLRHPEIIERSRDVKCYLGPIHEIPGIPKHRLCNGSIDMEPICHLGRWRNQGDKS